MKLLPCCLLSTALLLAPAMQAQLNQPPPPPKSKSAANSSNPFSSPKKSDKTGAKAKPTKEQMNETHTLAVMEVEFGGSEHQIIFELLGDKAPKTVQNFVDNVMYRVVLQMQWGARTSGQTLRVETLRAYAPPQ